MSGSCLRQLTPIYFALHIIGGYILLPLLVVTFLVSKRIKRHPTVVNFCLTWIIYSVSYSFLLYGGQKRNLCIAQLSMTYGSDAMVAAANLVLAIQVWSTFYLPWPLLRISQYCRPVKLSLMLAPPYIIFLTFSILGLHEAVAHSDSLNVDNGMYCAMSLQTFSRFTLPVVCSMFLLGASVFEVAVVFRRYSTWRTAKRACPDAYIKPLSLSPCLRAGIFLVYSWATLGACLFLLSAFESTNVYPYLVQATLPLVAFIVFGMQEDIAFVWFPCFRRRPPSSATTSSTGVCSRTFQNELENVDTATLESMASRV
ncbi:hypothetical protein DAEQUDRAFT_720233 [Daedalea quercina L-15889]|uniref:G-protein coupled receptors family 1 profile domain-containing protein n=1 Tax=Daedalea quercina L-15889 TaxID=1314783 RepID=A0A165UJZ6_9APHY|nr:hypothetical protein DAEQUDRAFT_720233 [Daedalea quercina L-15889]